MSRPKPTQPIGVHAGRALADIVSRVVVQTRAHTAVAEQEHRRRAIEGMMDDWEVEIGRAAYALLQPLSQVDSLPPGIQLLLDRANKPANQTDFILNLIAAIGGAIGVLFSWGPIFYRNQTNELNRINALIPLSPADAADATVKLGMSRPTAYHFAALNGIEEESFGIMCDLAGEPPPLNEMRQMVYEGRLSQGDFETMFRYSHVRDEWLDNYLAAHYRSMSAADAVEGFVKGQLDHGQALHFFTTAGGMADQFDIATAIAGNPIGVEQAGALYNRHLITDAEYTAVIRHSRINPMFEAMAKKTRFHYLSAFQIERMLTQGTVSAQDATRWLLEDGYPADQVAGLVSGATGTKAVKAKTASLAVVIDSYEAGLIAQPEAIVALANLGYSATEAEVELKAYDARRILALTNQGVTAIRKAYLADKMSRNKASAELDSLGVNANLRDHYLALWDVEMRAEFKTLTMAQIGNLYKKGYLSERYTVTRWEAMGYPSDDAELLLYEYGKVNPNGQNPVR